MHVSMRYGNKEGIPVFHIDESINQGRVCPRGIPNQGWLKTKLENYQLTHPNQRISIDLRASNDQIVAVGQLDPNSYDTTPDMWSGDTSYRRAWNVKWKEVFRKPLTQKEFLGRYGIEDNKLKGQFHHAQHSWVSPDLTIIVDDSPAVADSWLGDTFQYLREQIHTINVLDALLAQSMEHNDHLVLKKVYEVAMSVLDKYPKQEAEMSDEWRNTIVTKKATKKTKGKRSSRKKMSPAQKRDKSFAKKMRRIIAEAESVGITSDYAMAKYFSEKGYARKDGKRKWISTTVKKYRSKYVLDKS